MAVDWVNGPWYYAGGLDRNLIFDPRMVGAIVGYFGDPAQANPVVGELYTAHLVVGVGFPPRGGVLHSTRIRLPPSTTFNLGSGIRCYRQRPGEANRIDATNDPSANCVKNPTSAGDGSYQLGQRDLPQGNLFEIQFDVVTSAPITNQLLTGYVESEYGTGGPLACIVPVTVFPAPAPPNFNGTWIGEGTAAAGAFPPGRKASFRLEIQQSGSAVTMAEYDDWVGGGFPVTPQNRGTGTVSGRQVTISTVQAVDGDAPIRNTWTLSVNNSNTILHIELHSENPPSFPFPRSTVVGDFHQ